MSEKEQQQTEEARTTDFIYHLLENPLIKEQISQAIFTYGTLREIAVVKRQEQLYLQASKERRTFEDETGQACNIAADQAARDIPYVKVVEVRPHQYHFQSGRWYIEVDLQHHDPDEGAATTLYRVWNQPDGSMAATKVDIRETEDHTPTQA